MPGVRPVVLPGFAGRPCGPVRSLADLAEALHREYVGPAPRPRILLGHGVGGSLLLEYLRCHADEVDQVILHAPVGARLDRRWFPRLMKPRPFRVLGRELFVARPLRPLWSRLLFERQPPDQFYEDYRRCQLFTRMFEWLTPEWFSSLSPRAVPAVLLWGARERVLSVRQADDFLALLPGARVHVEPGWNHFPMLDRPEEYGRVLSWLSGDGGTRDDGDRDGSG